MGEARAPTFCDAELLDVRHLAHDGAEPHVTGPLVQVHLVVRIVFCLDWVPQLQRHVHTCERDRMWPTRNLHIYIYIACNSGGHLRVRLQHVDAACTTAFAGTAKQADMHARGFCSVLAVS